MTLNSLLNLLSSKIQASNMKVSPVFLCLQINTLKSHLISKASNPDSSSEPIVLIVIILLFLIYRFMQQLFYVHVQMMKNNSNGAGSTIGSERTSTIILVLGFPVYHGFSRSTRPSDRFCISDTADFFYQNRCALLC